MAYSEGKDIDVFIAENISEYGKMLTDKGFSELLSEVLAKNKGSNSGITTEILKRLEVI